MHRAFSFAMERSRYKERLEATLAGLCELEMLKQRQESLVLSALRLGDSTPGCARAAWPLIPHCFPSSSNLEQEQPGAAGQQVKVIQFTQTAHSFKGKVLAGLISYPGSELVEMYKYLHLIFWLHSAPFPLLLVYGWKVAS